MAKTKTPKRPLGRPSSFSKSIGDEICRRMSNGESLLQICRDEKMPPTSTVNDWVRRHSAFSADYVKAREELYKHWAEECLDIADDGKNDWIKRETKSGRIIDAPDNEVVNRSRLRVDTRKWLLSKLLPKEYGDKFDVTSSDGSMASAFRAAMAVADKVVTTKSNGHDTNQAVAV